MAITYATWNPSDKNANITLSGGDLTATGVNGAWYSVRSTISVSSGKWYWEYVLAAAVNADRGLAGIALSTATLAQYGGFDANGWTFYPTGVVKINNNVQTAYGSTFTATDVMGVALDMDGGTIDFYKNNTLIGTAYSTGITGSMFAICSTVNVNGPITANFGATTMAYTAPSGYNQGLYTSTGTTTRRLALMGVGN